MNLKLQGLLLFVALLVIFPLGLSIFAFKASPPAPFAPVPPLGATLGTPPPSFVAATQQAIAFHDESEAWNWENNCAQELARFVTGHGFSLSNLMVTLVDEKPDLPLGIVYPAPADPEAMVLTGCVEGADGLACDVAVAAATPGDALDTAMAASLGYGVREHFRTKTQEAWDEGQTWHWADFQPLIEPEGERWRSVCLEMTK